MKKEELENYSSSLDKHKKSKSDRAQVMRIDTRNQAKTTERKLDMEFFSTGKGSSSKSCDLVIVIGIISFNLFYFMYF